MEKTPKILLLLTGGTIGSAVNDGSINVDSRRGDDLLTIYHEQNNCEVEFEIIRPFNILSENAEPQHWLQIIKTLQSHRFKRGFRFLMACAQFFTTVKQGKLDIFLRRGAGKQVKALKNKAQIGTAQQGALIAIQLFHRNALKQVTAARRHI